MLSVMSWGLYQFLFLLYVLFLILLFGLLVIFLLFWMICISYVKQVVILVVKKVKYKSLICYVLFLVCILMVVNLFIISLLCNSDFFVIEGQWLMFKLIIVLFIFCGVVLVINLFFLCFFKWYVFLGRFFLQEIDLFFFSENVLLIFFVKLFWFWLFILLVIEVMWIMLVLVLVMFVEWWIWFEVYFLFCYVLCLIYYFFYC